MDLMQYGTGETCALWGAAILRGEQWSVIKTAPFELLCEVVDRVPRISQLARELGCDAFQLNLYDGDSLTLVETNSSGAFRISGFVGSDGPDDYHGFQISEDKWQARFGLVRVPSSVELALIDEDATSASFNVRRILYGNPDACDNRVQLRVLIPHVNTSTVTTVYAAAPHLTATSAH